MSTSAPVTRKDLGDVLNVLDVMITRIDERFANVEDNIAKTQVQISAIQNHLDSIEKRIA